MQRALSAPGKLFLSGEYAVLWGGTARIGAVGPRTAALVRRRADRDIHLVLAEGRIVGTTTPVGVRWKGDVPPGFFFAARTLDEALRAHGAEALGFELAIAPSPTSPDGHKLGMGGSACATVLAAEAARFVLEDRYDALKLALLAHGKAQQLKGSGGDVAAIFAGGIVRYRRYAIDALVRASDSGRLAAALAESPPVDLWRLPSPKVHLAYAFTRKSASTRVLIGEVESRLGEEGRVAFVRTSDQLGDQLEEGLLRGDFAAVREAARELEVALASLGPLETEAMRQVIALAETCGCAGKLSGAGGGDGCILFAPDEDALHALTATLAARGFHAFALSQEPGLRGEGSADPELLSWLHSG
ncbi:MAG: phosphomevalonate kinase [Myxococcaceae bacterium]|nr:phosphomevalonate kinase [Myxococcaceae bacterium]